jgi:D-alanyl-D-alanine carboxypeptidase
MNLVGRAECRGSWGARKWVWFAAFLTLLAFANGLLACGTAIAKPSFSAIAVDARTGNVLFARDADGSRHPASLTKVMTLYLLFEDLKAGRLSLDSRLRVSQRAAQMAPSKLGLKAGSDISVDQAIRALVTRSANDVAATIAENLGGSEAAFAQRMTRTARSLGMSRTTFHNASGLPHPGQVTTARDMATLSLRIQRDFPQYYPYFKIASFNYKGRVIRTHNRLIGRYKGADGIKTGYIRASGYNLTTSAVRGQKRIVGVVLGATSGSARNRYMMAMLDQAFPKCRDGSAIVASVGGVGGGREPAQTAVEPAETFSAKRPVKDKTARAQNAMTPAASEGADNEDQAEDTGSISDADKSALDTMLSDHPETSLQASVPPNAPFEIKPSTEASGTDSWHIQVGAYPTKVAAETEISLARKAAARELADKQAFTVEVQKGAATIYRARFSGFSENSAKDVCRTLNRNGISCLTLAPQG